VESWVYTWRDASRQAIVPRFVNTEPAGARCVRSGTTDPARSVTVCCSLCYAFEMWLLMPCYYFVPVSLQSIAMSISVSVSECLSACIS